MNLGKEEESHKLGKETMKAINYGKEWWKPQTKERNDERTRRKMTLKKKREVENEWMKNNLRIRCIEELKMI